MKRLLRALTTTFMYTTERNVLEIRRTKTDTPILDFKPNFLRPSQLSFLLFLQGLFRKVWTTLFFMHSLSALFLFLLTDSMLLSLPLPKTY